MTENLKLKLIGDIVKREGGYVNDPLDSGGETNFGITLVAARSYGYGGDMIDFPRTLAFDIYVERYWNTVHGDSLLALSPTICEEVVDSAVNMGVSRAIKILQRSLKVLGDMPVNIDGHIGNETLYALKSYLAVRDPKTLLKALNCLQGAFYINLADRREKDERFVYGWLRNRVVI